jgi:hypothetical protein
MCRRRPEVDRVPHSSHSRDPNKAAQRPAAYYWSMLGLGTVDLVLSVFYSALFVLVVVISYLSPSRRKSRN